jgi:hypothetical protein
MKDSTLIGRFNHRILKADENGYDTYRLVSVYYDLDGTPTDYSEPECFGCISGLYDEMIERLKAFNRPVLDEKEIDLSRSVLEKEDKMIGRCHQEKMWD